MGLSRLDNFLKSTRGTIIYVDPNSLDSTDSVENQGNSLARPFKTIQRALIEAARFSYQRGKDNDRFGKTTILLYPGDHIVDNRPGYIPLNDGTFRTRDNTAVADFTEWSLTSNYDLSSANNELYKLNSVHGGVIVPRGTSIVGMDLRKTKIIPKYVPHPDISDEGQNIEPSAIFRVTGSCYFWQFSIFDCDPNSTAFFNYTKSVTVPNFSHHRLRAFEYADGTNNVEINDTFFSNFDAGRTDLDMYYEKVGLVYGQSSGREIPNDYPPADIVDIEPVIDEYRIVGPKDVELQISAISAADTTVTVTTSEPFDNISINTAIEINGVTPSGYDGKFVVSEVVSDTQFKYIVPTTPVAGTPNVSSATVTLIIDTVSSASPYIFNISLRSVYGMCGLLADGDKATGFKSMVVAQYTGVGLQKDDNAFVKYDSTTGVYKDINSNLSNLSTDSRSLYKPEYQNFHIKGTNDAVLQLVSVFAIGFAEQFVAENGADLSISNSNSNFGAKALVSSGFKRNVFSRDDIGYITHIISPEENESEEFSVEFDSIDVEKTISIGDTSRLYIYNQTLESSAPNYLVDGYRIGARPDDKLYVNLVENGSINSYSTKIIIPNTEVVGVTTLGIVGTDQREDLQFTYEKSFDVARSSNDAENKIVDNRIIFTEEHQFLSGESLQIISDDGALPDGIIPGRVYFAITDSLSAGIGSTEIKLASSYADALQGNELTINSNGGNLTAVSRVSDKVSGDIGHPIQWDSTENQWYINVSDTTVDNLGDNGIYQAIVGLGTTALGESTPRTYFRRKVDTRNFGDSIYKVRYVIPKTSDLASRSPLDAFVLQESSSGVGDDTEAQKYFDVTNTFDLINDPYDLRSAKFISNCVYSSGTVTVTSELSHNLSVGSEVTIKNVISTNNTDGDDNEGYNGSFVVTEVVDAINFKYSLSTDPGTFSNNVNLRTASLPRFYKSKLKDTYQLYRSQQLKEYKFNEQDGVYHLIITKNSITPAVAPFTSSKFSQPIDNLYPQQNRDNPISDPDSTRSFARSSIIGTIDVNNPENSLTKESVTGFIESTNIGVGITNIISDAVGTSHTIYTSLDHGLYPVSTVSIVGGGSTYVAGTYYNVPLQTQTGTTGKNATAVVTVGASGTVTNVAIMHGGSAYEVGDSLKITDTNITRNPTGTDAILSVSNVIDSTNDAIQVVGSYTEDYDNLYRVTGVTNGVDREIEVISSRVIAGVNTTTGVGVTDLSDAYILNVGKALGISTISHNGTTGITSITFATSHGFSINDKVRVGGATSESFNGDFIVKNVKSTLSINAPDILEIDLGIKQALTPPGGTIFVYPFELTSQGGKINSDSEPNSARLVEIYGGVTGVTTSTIDISATEANSFEITDALAHGFRLGDFIQIDDEILRISRPVTSNTVFAHRAVLGTSKESHKANSVIKKLNPIPVELRRNSIIKASGHTFEYVGFGPGNYSTALPDKQDRVLSEKEEIVAQSTRYNGGISIFSGMNSDGDFYTGNKKVNSSTGEEKIFDAPVPSVTGEEIQKTNVNVGFDVLSPLEINVNRSIRVEGGSDGNLLSKFDGPVIFNNKITSYAERGIEAKSLYLQGDLDVSRKITYSDSVPTISGNYGDIAFNSIPEELGFSGWIFSTDNTWQEFGFVGGQGVGIYSGGDYIGFSSALDIVGVGLTISVETSNVINGITTITIDDNPVIAISTGAFNTLVGQANQLNFVGGGITVSDVSTAGVVTIFMEKIDIDALAPAGNYNTFQYHQNDDTFAGLDYFVYNDTNDNIQISDVNFTRGGYVSLGTTNPSSKVEIHSDNERSLYINSTSGSGEIIRIENSATDTKPFIMDINGHIGINTDSIATGISLDIAESAGVTGELRFYNPSRSNYIGFEAPTSISSNVIWTLPSVAGTAYSIFAQTSTPGVIGWFSVRQLLDSESVTTDDVPEGVTNLYHTIQRVVDAYISRIGETDGIDVDYNTVTGNIDYHVNFNDAPYPYTTKGFNLPL